MREVEAALFKCAEQMHALKPEDPLDPAGTTCQCGAVEIIGVMAEVNRDHKKFLYYLVEAPLVDDGAQPYRGVALRAIDYLRALQQHIKLHGLENIDYFFDSATDEAEALLARADVVMQHGKEDEDGEEGS